MGHTGEHGQSLQRQSWHGAYAVQQRSLENFQFELENVLTMSQLIVKSAEERNTGLGDAGRPCRYQEQDCSRSHGRDRHRGAKTERTKRAVRGDCGKRCQTSQSDCT